MGWQQFGSKKIRRLADLTGLPLTMVWNHQGQTTEFEGRTTDDEHVWLNARTGEWQHLPRPWSRFESCPKDHAWHTCD